MNKNDLVSIGAVRCLDSLGRICIPSKIVFNQQLNYEQLFAIYMPQDNCIMLEPVDNDDIHKNKQTMLIRKMDALNRIVIPVEIRKRFNLKPKSKLEIFINSDGNICLVPYRDRCVICGNTGDLHNVKKSPVCEDCIETIKGM